MGYSVTWVIFWHMSAKISPTARYHGIVAHLQASSGEPALGGIGGTWLHMQRLGPAGQHVALGAHPHRVTARLRQFRPAAIPPLVAQLSVYSS